MMPASTELVVPTNREAVLALESPVLYLLEQAGEVAREILDERIVGWTQQGWTQREIAEEIGCSQQAISKRQMRLGVRPAQPNRPHKVQPGCTSENGSAPVDVEVVEAVEVIPGQLELDERTDGERLEQLSDDLVARVQADALTLDDAEQIADEREQRLQIWAADVRRAITVLIGLAGHPIPAGLINKLDQAEQATLTLLLAGVPAEEQYVER